MAKSALEGVPFSASAHAGGNNVVFFFDRERRVIERAQADSNRALTIGAAGRYEQALALFDEVIAEHASAKSAALRGVIAGAYFNKGVTLQSMGRAEQAHEVWREQARRFGADADAATARWVCMGLYNTACSLARSSRDHAAIIAVYEDLAARCDAHPGDPELFDIGCDALSNLAVFSEALEQPALTVAACDRLLARVGRAPRPRHRVHALNALGAKAVALGALGQHERALETMAAALDALGAHDAPDRTERVVSLLNNKGLLLMQMDRLTEASRVFESSYEASCGRAEPDTVVYGARALMNKALVEHMMGAHDAALASYGQVIDRFAGKPDPRLSEVAATSLRFSIDLLRQIGREQEARAVEARFEALAEQLKDADEQQLAAHALFEHARGLPAVDDRAAVLDAVVDTLEKHKGSGIDEAISARALATKGVELARAGRTDEAIEVWDGVLARMASRVDDDAVELIAHTMLNRAGALLTLSCIDEALAELEAIVGRFGQERIASNTVLAAKQTASDALRWRMERRALQPQLATLTDTRAMLDGLDEQLRSAPPLSESPCFMDAHVARGTLAATLKYAAQDRSRHPEGVNGWALVASFVKRVNMNEGRKPSAIVVEARPTLGAPAALDSNYQLMAEGMAVFGLPMRLAAQHTHIGLCCQWLEYPLKDTFVAPGVTCCCHFEAREAQS